MQHSEGGLWFTPAVHAGLIGTAVAAYAVHSSTWIAHQLSGSQAWPRPLELAYVITLVLWLSALALVYLGRSARANARAIDDERTRAQFVRAHQIALVVVVLAQIPFFVLDVPTKVLAQLTVTTSVVALAIAYAWLDR